METYIPDRPVSIFDTIAACASEQIPEAWESPAPLIPLGNVLNPDSLHYSRATGSRLASSRYASAFIDGFLAGELPNRKRHSRPPWVEASYQIRSANEASARLKNQYPIPANERAKQADITIVQSGGFPNSKTLRYPSQMPAIGLRK